VTARGHTVVGAARRAGKLDDLVAAHPGQVHPVALDVTDTARCKTAVDEVVERSRRLDVPVNAPT
jgi:NADP-dependent 3-hydroxy acid dehydrogenase YdfG